MIMIPILATVFDKTYLAKGIALIRSLQTWHANFCLFALALDEETERALRALGDERVNVVGFHAVYSPALQRALDDRDTAERCWTLTPYFTRWAMHKSEAPHITYIDADSYLFQPLTEVYREIQNANASVAIVPHRFPPETRWRERENGIYNVNFVFFKKDALGYHALKEWTQQCLEWCYRRTEHTADGALRFGDQGYLDDWEEKYGAHVVKHIGVNLAPWNQGQYEYTLDGRLFIIQCDETDPVRVTRIDPLILYHFHEHTQTARGYARTNYALARELIEHVYEPYERELDYIKRTITGGVAQLRSGEGAARARGATVRG